MTKEFYALAPMVLGGLLLSASVNASVRDSNALANEQSCMQAITDVKAQRESEPDIGPKAAIKFDEVVKEAEQLCAKKDFAAAGEALTLARGMIASE
ncbi:MAG: hypothetical protein KAH11_09385 [Rhodospirillales bacterium]|jgi:hypothetical protein|nr:hypothetical protein [Rhodospirillales bacterium]